MIQLSTVQLLLYRNLCDYLPMNEKHHHIHKEWILTSTDQEKALAQKHVILERYNKSSKELPEIPLASKVLIHEPSNRGIH